MTVLTRFAPSPTGLLHVGNARIALINWLFSRVAGGRFILRIDDTDVARSRPEFVSAIEEDLSWLGLEWDRKVHQSERLARYDAAVGKLKQIGRLYPCYETAEELEFKRKDQRSRGLPPVYDRAALELSDEEKKKLEAAGRSPHWRFLLNEGTVAWADLVHGEVKFESGHVSDPVLIRADGTPLYTLPSVVDDVELKVTHLIRGADHMTNTAAQIQLFEALGTKPPRFGHLPLLTDAKGVGLSKRMGSSNLQDLRADGIEAMALNSLIAKLGTSDAVVPRQTLEELVAGFDMEKLSRASPKFDMAELESLNARLLHDMPYAIAKARLAAIGLEDADEAFWMAVRPNLARIEDAEEWWAVCHGQVTPVITEAPFVSSAASLLPDAPFDEGSWKAWTDKVGEATGRKGKELFAPLRLALTGRDHGPEMKNLLPLIGRERALGRLSGTTV